MLMARYPEKQVELGEGVQAVKVRRNGAGAKALRAMALIRKVGAAPKVSGTGRGGVIALLDELLSEPDVREALRRAFLTEIANFPIKFVRDIVYPTLPRAIEAAIDFRTLVSIDVGAYRPTESDQAIPLPPPAALLEAETIEKPVLALQMAATHAPECPTNHTDKGPGVVAPPVIEVSGQTIQLEVVPYDPNTS